MQNEIMVSISCITYNHENYIAQAIESFLMQETDFAYEILIHDDASTDATAEIIKEYESKHPNLIKPIYQTENQYSKGINVGIFNQQIARGKYIAICEGDDYWIDPYKLQKQIDYMEIHQGCTFCFTNGIVIEDGRSKRKKIIPWLDENKKYYRHRNGKYTAGELQLLGYIPTASIVYPAYLHECIPDFLSTSIAGDNALKLFASTNGYAYLIDELTCAYRFNVPGSITTGWSEENRDETVKRCDGFIRLLDDFDKYSNYRYENEIKLSKLTWEFSKLRSIGDDEGIRDKRFKEYFRLLSPRNRIKCYLTCYFPKLTRFLKYVREILRNNLD